VVDVLETYDGAWLTVDRVAVLVQRIRPGVSADHVNRTLWRLAKRNHIDQRTLEGYHGEALFSVAEKSYLAAESA
jgi:hypothetical protein